MDTGLVTVLNTVTLATYQPFSLWSWLTFCTIIPHCLNSFTVLCHWHVQNITYKIYNLSYSERTIWSYARNMSPKSYSWKNYVVECWRQNAKFLYDMRSSSNAYYFACVRSEFANLEIWSIDLDLKVVHVLNFSADLNLVIYAFCLEQYWTKISLFIPRLNA